jgi:hypothetical protein
MGEFFSIGSYNACSLITTIVESQYHQKFGKAEMDTGKYLRSFRERNDRRKVNKICYVPDKRDRRKRV